MMLCAGLASVVWLLGLSVWWWSAGGGAPPGSWWASAGFGSVLWLWNVWQWRRPLEGRLAWGADTSGEPLWRWFSDAYRHGTPLKRVHLVLDWQSVVLVRAETSAGLGLWLWLDAGRAPDSWQAMRRALHFRARS